MVTKQSIFCCLLWNAAPHYVYASTAKGNFSCKCHTTRQIKKILPQFSYIQIAVWLQGRHGNVISFMCMSTVQYSTVRYSTVRYSTVQYSTVQYSTVQYSTVQYGTVQYSTVQYSTVQWRRVEYSTTATKQTSTELSLAPKFLHGTPYQISLKSNKRFSCWY